MNVERERAEDVAPDAQKTGRSVIIQLISWAIAIPIIFPTTRLLTSALGPVRYGEYSFVLAVLAVSALCSMTGMDPLISRRLSRQKREQWSETLGDAAGARLLTGLLVSGCSALVTCLIPMNSEQRNLLLLGYGTLLFSYSFNCLRAVYELGFGTEQKVSAISALSTINRVTTAGLIALAVFLHLSFLWLYVLISYSDLPFFLVLVVLAKRRYNIRLRFNLPRIWRIVVESFAFTGHDALSLIAGQVDVFLLLPLAGSLSVGIYALAMRITNPLLNIVYAYVGGVFPYLSKKFEEGYKEFSGLYYESTRILALVIIPLCLFVVVTAPQIIALIAGSQFSAAIVPMQLLMCAVTLAFFSQLAVRACMAANKESRIPYVSGVSLGINILANVVFIPLWQASGASIAAAVSEFISVCLFSLLLVHYVQLWSILCIFFQIIVGCVPGVLFLFWQQQMSLLYLALIFGVCAFAGCVLTKAVSLKDVCIARQILARRIGKAA